MLSEYISSLPKEGKLSREEEARLWDAYKNEGELEARQKLIEHYQLLVFKEATKYPVQETVLLDLIQEGTVGLMEAAEKFDIEQGVAFSLYAIHRIRGRMLDFLRKPAAQRRAGGRPVLHCPPGKGLRPGPADL